MPLISPLMPVPTLHMLYKYQLPGRTLAITPWFIQRCLKTTPETLVCDISVLFPALCDK